MNRDTSASCTECRRDLNSVDSMDVDARSRGGADDTVDDGVDDHRSTDGVVFDRATSNRRATAS